MKKILILTTGGTIASKESTEGRIAEYGGEQLVQEIPKLQGLCELSIRDLMKVDSTNIQPEDWVIMAREAYEGLKRYDGIVITHGTDTMAYSSSMLSFMLKNLNKPLVLTGSQLSIDEEGTDARKNIFDAIITALAGYPGVYIVFGGRIIKGTRASKIHTTDFAAFASINAPLAGRIEDDQVVMLDPPGRNDGETQLEIREDDYDYGNVFLLKLIPGTNPDLIDRITGMNYYRGLVIEAFGLGGLPNINRSLLDPLKRAIDAGILVVVLTQCRYGITDMTRYEVGVSALQQGAIFVSKMTSESVVTKLMWLLGESNDPQEVKQLMLEDIRGELS